jgi:serine/threonine-protein kinase
LKPADILIDEPSEAVYLTDFGIAKRLDAPGLTQAGFFISTNGYLPPEQIEGLPLDGRTDIYGLGCILYECLTGVPPFDSESEISVMQAHLVMPVPNLTSARPDLPKQLNGVLASAMAKSKDDRYTSGQELIDELRKAVS